MTGPRRQAHTSGSRLAWLLVVLGISARSATLTWTNLAGGNWATPANWSPNQIPGANDSALITNSGNYAVSLGANAQVTNLVVGGAGGVQVLSVNNAILTVANGGAFGTNGVLDLSGSTLNGAVTLAGTNYFAGSALGNLSALTVASNAVLTLGGGSTLYLNGVLTNAGTVNWTGTGNLQIYNNYGGAYQIGGIVNLPGALFNAQNDQAINGSGTPYFINAGAFLKSPGTKTTAINVLFTNLGVLNVGGGIVAIAAGGADTGVITGAGSISVPGGTLTKLGVVPNLVLDGGTFNGASASIGNLTWSGGTLQGTNVLTGLGNWAGGGNIGNLSAFTVASNAVLTLGGGNTLYLDGVLTNAGTVNWTGPANLQIYNNYSGAYQVGGIVNLPGALFNAQNDQAINGSGTPFYINAGAFLKSPGTNTTAINVLYTNAGVLNVSGGTVAISAGGVDTGAIIGAGFISVPAGTLTKLGVVPNLVVNGGTFNGASASIGNLTWNSGTLQGSNTLTGVGRWAGGGNIGNLSALTVASNAVLTLGGGNTLYLDGVLTNAGTVNWTGSANLQIYNNYSGAYQVGGIVNLPGALFNAQNDQAINGSGSPYFNNAGTFLKSPGTNTTAINVLFTNAGVLNVTGGTVAISAGGVDTGAIIGAGFISVPGGTLTKLGVVPNLVLNGGTFNGVGASIGNLTWNSGTLQGSNTLTGMGSWAGGGNIGNLSAFTVASNAVLTLGGGNTLYLDGVLTNAGTVNWTGTGNLQIYNNYSGAYQVGGIVNLPGALFNAQNDQAINGSGSPYFNNAGTFLKSVGNGTSINLSFTNTGTINLTVSNRTTFGRIIFSGGVALAGGLNVSFLNSYSPATGDAFPLLTYASETGTFSAVNGTPLAWWQTNLATYGASVFTLTVGSFYQLIFTTPPVAATNAGAVLSPVVVQVEKLGGSVFPTNGVPILLALTTGSGVLGGTVVRNTDASGKASFTDLSLNLVGAKTLQASASNWIYSATNGTTIIPGAPAQLQITRAINSPQRQGYTFAPAPTVEVLDAFGNLEPSSTALITANAVASGGGVLAGTTTVNANGTNGLATFGNLHFNPANPTVSESVSVFYTSPGLTPATNATIQVDFVFGKITLTNGNSVVQIDPNSQDGVFSWVVDGTEQLFQQWFWLRQGNSGAQVSLDQLGAPLGSAWTSSNAVVNYLPQGLNVTVGFTLQGGGNGSGTASLIETMVLQNTNAAAASLHFYAYSDFDLAGTNTGDTLSFPTNNLALQQGKGVTVSQSIGGMAPSYWEGGWYSFAYDTINSATPAVLPDALIPNLAGDQTFAFQWDYALNLGQSWVLNLTNTIQAPVKNYRLSINPAGSNLLLAWAANYPATLTLQTSTNLATGAWQTITNAPVLVGPAYQVTIPPAGNAQFFRLH